MTGGYQPKRWIDTAVVSIGLATFLAISAGAAILSWLTLGGFR